jgi:hypothetical protein
MSNPVAIGTNYVTLLNVLAPFCCVARLNPSGYLYRLAARQSMLIPWITVMEIENTMVANSAIHTTQRSFILNEFAHPTLTGCLYIHYWHVPLREAGGVGEPPHNPALSNTCRDLGARILCSRRGEPRLSRPHSAYLQLARRWRGTPYLYIA